MSDEQKTAADFAIKLTAVLDTAHDIFVATGRYVPERERELLARLYDRAHEEGRESGIAQAGIALGASSRAPEPAEHRIVALPGSVFSRTQGALPEISQAPVTPDSSYPLRALCSECHEPVRCETAESPWEHA